MGINKNITSALFLLFSLCLSAQQNTVFSAPSVEKTTPESLFLHLNASTFVSGETLFYKIYSLNQVDNTISQISKVAYVELIDSKKNSIVKHKLFLKEGLAKSDLFVPITLKTGTYKLIAYTTWMLNKKESDVFQQEIFIINPFEELSENNIAKENENYVATKVNGNSLPTNSTSELKVNLNKKTFNQREEAIINFTSSKNLSGNYSVSVRKTDSLPSPFMFSAFDFKNNSNKSSVSLDSKKIILPEMRGELISGKIEAEDKNLQVQNIAVALSIPGKSFVFKIVRTNKQGEFFFIIDQNYQNQEYVIQVIGEKNIQYSVSINKKETVDLSKLSVANNFKINSKIKNTLKERSISSQIENAYFSKKTDSVTAVNQKYFYDPSSKSYRLDDYTRFATLRQSITEVVKEMSYSRSGGKYIFHLKDFTAQTQVQEPVLTLVDGILVQDVSDIIDYDAKNIEKINIVPKGYIYGGTVTSGFVSIFTKDGSFNTDALSTKFFNFNFDAVPQKEKIYFEQIYDAQTKSSRIPDFRQQLLWLPELKLTEKNTKISLFTSDIPGNYEISVEGFSEKGEPISLKETFIVE
ncbi:hypothetical protein ACFPVY_09935 [Flavobacterium qiangtangense]|uniref:TonB-dependent receptor n=1 Tax=Flavobacterium qiangtangense TaxID=1442595 RepID=A0ABW1PPJ4_9FLAO